MSITALAAAAKLTNADLEGSGAAENHAKELKAKVNTAIDKVNELVSRIVMSPVQTGDASPQTWAHGLGTTPSVAFPVLEDDASVANVVFTFGTHDATDTTFTAPNGVKYRVVAIA